MPELIETHLFEKVAHRLAPQSQLRRVWSLTGGVSAQVTALEVERPDGSLQQMVVRRHGAADRQDNPQIAADEYRLLQLLQAAGLPAPRPLYLDQTETIFDIPYLVIEYIDGKPEFAPPDVEDFIQQFTTVLVGIHEIRQAKTDLSFLPDVNQKYRGRLLGKPIRNIADEVKVHTALAAVWPVPQVNEACLLHADFWPGNILWREDRLVAVIDWEDALVGDPVADVANCRLEMLWAFGREAMETFSAEYRTRQPHLDFSQLPYWDLWAAWRKPTAIVATWGLNEATVKAMRAGHQWFVAQAFEALARGG